MNKQVTFSDLKEMSDDIKNIVNIDKDYDFDYVYNIRKILKKVKSEMEDIKDCLHEDTEKFSDYQQELFDLGVECGAEKIRMENGIQLNFNTDDFNKKQFTKGQKEIDDKYEETLEKQKEIQQQNQDIIENKKVDVDFPTIPKEAFPEKFSFDELPDSLIDLIE